MSSSHPSSRRWVIHARFSTRGGTALSCSLLRRAFLRKCPTGWRTRESRIATPLAAKTGFAVLRLLKAESMITPGSRDVSVTRDPTDDKVIAAALETGAEYIVTGDKDLLTLGKYEGVGILTPARFISAIREQQQSR